MLVEVMLMAAKARYLGPPDALVRYEDVVAGNPAVERKGAATPYTSVNGHMFSFVDAGGVMALRLPSDLREQFVTKYDATIVEQHGRVMAEYVAVPVSLLRNRPELQKWFDRSHAWVATLKPKPTARPNKP